VISVRLKISVFAADPIRSVICTLLPGTNQLVITQASCRYAKLPVHGVQNCGERLQMVSAAAACSRWSVGVYNMVHSLINCAVENKKHCIPPSVVHSFNLMATRRVIRRDAFWECVEWKHLWCCCSCSSRSTLQCTRYSVARCWRCLSGLRKIPVQDITCCSIRRRCLTSEGQDKCRCWTSRRPALEASVYTELCRSYARSACPLACWSDNAANFLPLAAQAKRLWVCLPIL